MQDSNKEIDEKTYLDGCPLNKAVIKYCSSIAIQNYKSATNVPKSNSADKFENTFIGLLNITGEAIQNLQRQKENIKNATDALYREIIALIKNGTLIPYSYQLPRNLSDLPIRIPIDIFMAGNINWANSELIYKNFEFTGIRLIEPLQEITEIPIGNINNQNHEKEEKSFKAPPPLKNPPLKKSQLHLLQTLIPTSISTKKELPNI